MIKMVADQLDVFAGFGGYGIIGDQHFFFQRRILAMGNDFQRQKVDQFSLVEPLMVNESIIGVFVSLDLVFKTLTGPKIGQFSFQKGKQYE